MRTLLALIGLLALIPALEAAAPATVSGEFDIKFGIVEFNDAGEVLVKETIHIPLHHRTTSHGFILRHRDGVPFSAYLRGTLPRLPGAQGAGFIWDGHQFATPKRDFPGEWVFVAAFDPGDPEGLYVLEVFVNDKLVQRIEYRVYYP